MIKKITIVILFISCAVISCGKKGDPEIQMNQIKKQK